MNIQKNYFELFGLPLCFEINLQDLSIRYRQLQREVHPDRFAGAGERDKRLAVQYASYVNEAFETLKSPLLRAEYLLTLAGLDIDRQSTTTTESAFLMQQMALRETLSEVRDKQNPEQALDDLSEHVATYMSELQQAFSQCYRQSDLSEAQAVVSKLHFMTKLANEVMQLDAELLDE